MAATGNEVPLLSQLLNIKNYLVSLINKRLISPSEPGSKGQLLVWQLPGSVNNETIWMDPIDVIPSASHSSNGLMSSADKKKLDGLSVGGSNVDIVKTNQHKASYDKDTLEIVVNSTGKVTSMYFISA